MNAIDAGSKCTFWRSVLSDAAVRFPVAIGDASLNAPFGARCFLTEIMLINLIVYSCLALMHLLALGAF